MRTTEVVTRRLKGPKPPKSKRNRTKTPATPVEELRGFLARTGWALYPLVVVVFLALSAAAFAHHEYAKLYWVAGAGFAVYVVYRHGWKYGVRKRRPTKNLPAWLARVRSQAAVVETYAVYAYAYGIVATAFVWVLVSTWDGLRPSTHNFGTLLFLTVFCAVPWWRYRASKGTVLVTFLSLPREERDRLLKHVQAYLIRDWTGFASASQISGSKLRGVIFDEWSVTLDLVLRRGMSAREFNARRRGHMESACPWPCAEGRVRVEGDSTDAQLCTVRYMLKDPHAEPIKPDPDEKPTPDSLIIGVFETGADVQFELVNTLIGGLTRSGKSNLINRLVQLFAKIPTIAILGADFTEGATELTPWRDCLHALATNGAEFEILLDQITAECDRRGRIMTTNGWKVFRCTADDPFMTLIIDEGADVKQMGLHHRLKQVTAKIGKYGGCVIFATQYPTAPNAPKEITANLTQKIGLATDGDTADRVIFGSTATRKGFCPSELITGDRQGSFLIKNKYYQRPLLARVHYIEEHDIARDVPVLRQFRTEVPTIRMTPITVRQDQGEIEAGTVITERLDIVDAEIVDPTEDSILEALDLGIGTPKKIAEFTDIPDRTVKARLKSLADRGRIKQTRVRGPWVRV